MKVIYLRFEINVFETRKERVVIIIFFKIAKAKASQEKKWRIRVGLI